jgi:hypothetical protein
MHIMQSRRDFLTTLFAAGSAGFMDARGSLADEGSPAPTTVRRTSASGICVAPQYLAGNLLRADGFSDVRFVPGITGPPGAAMIGRGEADFTSTFAASVIVRFDAARPHPPSNARLKPNGRQLTVLFVDLVGWSGHPHVTAPLLTSLGHHEGAAIVDRMAVHAARRLQSGSCWQEGCPEPLETPAESLCYIPR